MKELSKIIVPVDFLTHTDKLVEYGIYMAEKLSAKIHFVHVVSFYSGDAMLENPYFHRFQDEALDDAKERMSNLIEDTQEKLPGCTGEVLSGDPVEIIVELAKAMDSDLIVISTHGAKGLEMIMLGSVAKRVLKRAHCPVLIMNPFKTQ
ncbi:MAG: universal stress protein [Bacteroidetes bacterium]|nr:universal stress protein [Bacteroidota bacterium]